VAMTQKELLKEIEQARVEKRSVLDLRRAGLTSLPGKLRNLTNLPAASFRPRLTTRALIVPTTGPVENFHL